MSRASAVKAKPKFTCDGSATPMRGKSQTYPQAFPSEGLRPIAVIDRQILGDGVRQV